MQQIVSTVQGHGLCNGIFHFYLGRYMYMATTINYYDLVTVWNHLLFFVGPYVPPTVFLSARICQCCSGCLVQMTTKSSSSSSLSAFILVLIKSWTLAFPSASWVLQYHSLPAICFMSSILLRGGLPTLLLVSVGCHCIILRVHLSPLCITMWSKIWPSPLLSSSAAIIY